MELDDARPANHHVLRDARLVPGHPACHPEPEAVQVAQRMFHGCPDLALVVVEERGVAVQDEGDVGADLLDAVAVEPYGDVHAGGEGGPVVERASETAQDPVAAVVEADLTAKNIWLKPLYDSSCS